LEKLLEETDLTYLGFYYKKQSENSEKAALFLLNISQKLDYLSGIILINCEDNSEFEKCKTQDKEKNIDVFPVITLFIPPELKFNPYTKKFNKHYERLYDKNEFSENLVYNFVTSNILNKGLKLNPDNIDDFLNNQEYNKLVLFTDKKQTPLIFRGLSNYFYNQLLFGEIEKDQEPLIKKFGVKSFPTLMIYKTQEDSDDILEEPVIEFYKGKINAKNIVEFISEYALKNKKYLEDKNQNRKSTEIDYAKSIKEINSDKLQENNFFDKNKNKKIVLYLNIDKNLEKLRTDKDHGIEKQNQIIPDFLRKFYFNASGFFYFYRINCICEKELAFCKESLKAKEFPTLILLSNKSFEKPEYLPLDYEELQNEILKLFPSELNYVNPQNFQTTLQSTIISNKIPIFYFYQENVPLGIHLILNEGKFKTNVEFLAFEAPPKEILNNFQVKKLPELVIVLNDPNNPGR